MELVFWDEKRGEVIIYQPELGVDIDFYCGKKHRNNGVKKVKVNTEITVHHDDIHFLGFLNPDYY